MYKLDTFMNIYKSHPVRNTVLIINKKRYLFITFFIIVFHDINIYKNS